MEKKALLALLGSVRTELDDPGRLDAEAATLLMQLHDDIELLLEMSSEAEMTHREPVQTNAANFIERFKASHPDLTQAMNHVLNIFAGSGV